jgi:hypothetical protein
MEAIKSEPVWIGHCRECGIEIEVMPDGGVLDMPGADLTLCDGCDYEINGYEAPEAD